MSNDMCEVCVYSTPVARKDHRCAECRGRIKAGEQYWVFSGIDPNHEPFRVKRCVDCQNLCSEIDRGRLSDEGVVFEGLSEEMCELDKLDPLRVRFIEVRKERKWTKQEVAE